MEAILKIILKFSDISKAFAYDLSNNPVLNTVNGYATNTPSSITEYINKALEIIMIIGTTGVFIMASVGAFIFLNSAGDPEVAKKGQNTMINAGIGFALLVATYAIVVWYLKITTGASTININI
ncbi:MAG: hypothetical protein WCW17_01295 [Patescibacteria group bacterium]|jgi:hypothetical protein